MDFLARREHSLYELEHKLRRKFLVADTSLIREVLTHLEEENLLSDMRFTESYIRHKKERGFGYLKIREDLIAKGIDHKIIEAKLLVDDDWLAIIHRVINKKVGDNKTITVKSREHSKLIRFLMMRGFKREEISEAVSNLRC